MKMDYFPETDSLYIKLKEGTYLESEEIASGFVVDFDVDGNVMGLDIDFASNLIDLKTLETKGFPTPVQSVSSPAS